jgi:hypothetical protein
MGVKLGDLIRRGYGDGRMSGDPEYECKLCHERFIITRYVPIEERDEAACSQHVCGRKKK